MRPSFIEVARRHSIRGGRARRGVDTLVQALSVVVAVPPPIEPHGALVCSTVALVLVQTGPVSCRSNIDTGCPRERRPIARRRRLSSETRRVEGPTLVESVVAALQETRVLERLSIIRILQSEN
jgi:hypothetical protein